MKLGTCTLTVCPIDPFDAVRLKSAWYIAEQPQAGYLALAALVLSTEGHGLPDRRANQSFVDWGQELQGGLVFATRAKPKTIQAAADTAVRALAYDGVSVDEVNEWRDFFGVERISSAPFSPGATEEAMPAAG